MLQIRVGEKGMLELNVKDIKITKRGSMEVLYENIHEPAYASLFKVDLTFDGSLWHIRNHLVYKSEIGVYKDVGGLFSSMLTDALKDGLVDYYMKQRKKDTDTGVEAAQ